MGDSLHLPNAPILEALIDLQFSPSVSDTDESSKILELKRLIGEPFGNEREFNVWQTQVSFNAGATPLVQSSAKKKQRLDSKDSLNVIQYNREGLTYSRLKPYVSWDQFSVDFYRIWTLYNQVFKPIGIIRTAVRFINVFPFETKTLKLEDFFLTFPTLGPAIKMPFLSYSMQFTIAEAETNSNCTVTQLAQPGANGPTVIFDIDAFNNDQFPVSEERLKSRLEDLHKLKNKVFFGSLSAKALGEFK